MRQDLLDTSDQNSSRRGALVRVMAAALIVLGIASIAFLVQPEASRPTTGDFGTASVVNLVDANRSAGFGLGRQYVETFEPVQCELLGPI